MLTALVVIFVLAYAAIALEQIASSLKDQIARFRV